MNSQRFAQLLGVHVTTAYRWEAAGTQPVSLDPLQESLLAHMQRQLAEKMSKSEREQWKQELIQSLLVGGTLVGLAFLLVGLLGKGKK